LCQDCSNTTGINPTTGEHYVLCEVHRTAAYERAIRRYERGLCSRSGCDNQTGINPNTGRHYIRCEKHRITDTQRVIKRVNVNRIPKIIYDTKRGAAKRGLPFDLTNEQFETLLKRRCYLCGAEPNPLIGVDRIDNTKGYTVENSVSCCWVCNRMKADLSLPTFIAHINRINEVLGEGET
jgi:hypothetical protein